MHISHFHRLGVWRCLWVRFAHFLFFSSPIPFPPLHSLFFCRRYRDHPRDHPEVCAAELAHITGSTPPLQAPLPTIAMAGSGAAFTADPLSSRHVHALPWRQLLSSHTVRMLMGQYIFFSYAWYFYITWFPTYLKESFASVGDFHRALLASIPLFFGGIGSLCAGTVSAWLEQRYGEVSKARRVLGSAAMGSAGCFLVLSVQFTHPVLSVLCVGLASLSSDLTLPSAWGVCMDVGGDLTGSVSAIMNSAGQIGGAIAPMVVPLVRVLLTCSTNGHDNMSTLNLQTRPRDE